MPTNENINPLPTSATRSSTSEPEYTERQYTTRGQAQQQADERRRAINLLIVAAHAGYGTQAPEAEAMAAAVEVWKDALDLAGVPNDQLRAMLARCNAGRGSNYPPSVSEIVAQWSKFQSEQPTKTFQQTEAESGRAALPPASDGSRGRSAWTMLGQRLRQGRGNVLCKCSVPAAISGDGFDWVCGDGGNCDFMWPTARTLDAPFGGKAGPLGEEISGSTPKAKPQPVEMAEAVPLPESREYSDDELLEELDVRCNFNVEGAGRDVALSFAQHLKGVAAVTMWTPALAKGQWAAWNRKQEQAVAA